MVSLCISSANPVVRNLWPRCLGPSSAQQNAACLLIGRLRCADDSTVYGAACQRLAFLMSIFDTWEVPAVSLLLFPSRPAAVTRRVAFVVVPTFQGVLWGRFRVTYGPFVEVQKLQPVLTDRDPASTVVFPTLDPWISAAANH
jgi:hypothetical protein